MNRIFRRIYHIEGIIQGVGFRPTLYCYALEFKIGGWIKNCSGKVELSIEGTEKDLDEYIIGLNKSLPKQARIDKLELVSSEIIKEKSEFRILESEKDSASKISIPADLAMCKDCEKEILNPNNRRYEYPFTTCINCGPRYTVLNSMPYDRCRTTLFDFPLCPECEKEYKNPADRRFHAESTACPVCGPKLWIVDKDGNSIDVIDPILYTGEKIAKGGIAAIRGIGGYLLAVDALNTTALDKLRKRKNRPDKPFAVMAADIDVIKKYCRLSEKEEKLLESSISPIMILDVKNFELPMKLLSPDTDTLGVMLPYTPLHKLLFKSFDFELLVMTSGNHGGEPICIKNEEAFERLTGIADFFLCHNREINLRNDDSLCITQDNEIQVWRRARGYAPNSIKLDFNSEKVILAMGAELKNTICVLDGNEAVISPHVGDLETPEAINGLQQAVDCFPLFLNKKPDFIAVDKHPDMHSTIIGKKTAGKLSIPFVEIQHHFSHAVSCMAENNLSEALALVFDGTGLGDDGNIWGAELLYCNLDDKLQIADRSRYKRCATFVPAFLPGGDAAVYHAVRQLIARLLLAGIDVDTDFLAAFGVSDMEYKIWKMQIDKKVNSPQTHAAGRLFDSFSSLLKIAPSRITYEGQGAIRLETYAKRALDKGINPGIFKYETFRKNNLFYIDWNCVFAELYGQKVWLLNDNEKEKLALTFHNTVAEAAQDMLKSCRLNTESHNIVLSGGVFMNRILTFLIKRKLENCGFNVFLHKKVPPNDGGISFGQSVIAGIILK